MDLHPLIWLPSFHHIQDTLLATETPALNKVGMISDKWAQQWRLNKNDVCEYVIAHCKGGTNGKVCTKELKLGNGFFWVDMEGFLEGISLNKTLKAWLVKTETCDCQPWLAIPIAGRT